MARASENIVNILRRTAESIESSSKYAWGHVGMCNCGHLVQSVTALSSSQIIRKAQECYLDEWSEYANDYCTTTGSHVDDLINALIKEGFASDDIHHIEYLSDKSVLHALPSGFRYLQKNDKYDVALYMRTWAALLELELKEKSKELKIRKDPLVHNCP
jgi:hypothetical protein